MLTAKLRNGTVITTSEKHSIAFWQHLRKKEEFYCRQCEEKMILKVGTKKIPHFAHKKGSTCVAEYERESEYHMAGKLRLYEWLQRIGLSPQLEYYFPKIQQRADIVFTFAEKTYCIEYQCSAISEENFSKRMRSYQKHSLHPIWILGGKNINRKKSYKVSLTAFQSLFLQKTPSGQWYIPSFCPEINKFIMMTNIFPLSYRNGFANFVIQPLHSTSIKDVLEPSFSVPGFSLREWRVGIKNFKTSFQMSHSINNSLFLQELYTLSLHPQLLPPYVGIPLTLNLALTDPPFIWQAYVFIDLLFGRERGTVFTFTDAYLALLQRMKRKDVHLRVLPNIKENLLPFVLEEYMQYLEVAGIIQKVGKKTFSICVDIAPIRNIGDFIRAEEHFYRKFILKRNYERADFF